MIPPERLRELAAGATLYGHERNAMAAELLAARETIERLTKERDAEAREAAGYQKIAKEAADAEKPGLLVLLVNQDGSEVRIFGPDRDAEERFGETVARWWKLLQVTSECLEHEDLIKAAEAERDAARAEAKKYHDALVARHGGEPVALLSELDAARAECAMVAKQRDEMVRMAKTWVEQVPDESLFASGNFDDCRDYGMAQAEVWCGEAILKAIAIKPANLSFNGVPIHLENSFLDGEQPKPADAVQMLRDAAANCTGEMFGEQAAVKPKPAGGA